MEEKLTVRKASRTHPVSVYLEGSGALRHVWLARQKGSLSALLHKVYLTFFTDTLEV